MGDNLRMAVEHPDCEVVGVCDPVPSRMLDSQAALGLTERHLFTDWQHCIEASRPDFLILCPATGDHALWVERLAPFGLPILIEKPMAASLADADRMLAACERHDVTLAINWPIVWGATLQTAKRCVDEGRIGKLLEVHHYGGNRGPLWHTAGKREISATEVAAEKPNSWFYKRAKAGGSMLDYLGYGTTIGTWFLGGAKPLEVTAVIDTPANLEVDEHSVTVARYEFGLSKFETRWGTYTDPWTYQPQPKCGFVFVGESGTLSAFDYAPAVRIQDREHPQGIDIPAGELQSPLQNPVQYFVDCLQHFKPIEGPLSPEISRIGQQIVDTAYASAQQKRTLELLT